MAPLDAVEPWKRDDVLVSAMAVEWVAKNVFLVSVPSYRRKLSCELTAVDVPRGTAAALTEPVMAVLRRVNRAMRLYLRQDLYSNFPLEGYGDIIFSAESRDETAAVLHWCSLQEALVSAGVACVVRPSVVRLAPLLAAEQAYATTWCSSAQPQPPAVSSWLVELQSRERSPLCCLERRCVVRDVMRGDVYRVEWLPAGTPSGEAAEGDEAAAFPAALELPPLLILDSTVCHSPSTQVGFAALRWAQLHLLHRELRVRVHAVYPSDRDVAFNTQLETCEHLANARGSAAVVDGDGAEVDVGVALLAGGLAWVRRVADAGCPRASNLFAAFRCIAERTAPALRVSGKGSRDVVEKSVEPSADVCAALGKLWGLPAPLAATLLAFHDTWWWQACHAAQLRASASRIGLDDGDGQAKAGTTALTWGAYVWCADLHRDPHDEPRVYRHRPLRTLFPLAGLAEWRLRLRGYLNGAAVVHAEGGRRFLQLEVVAVTPSATWRELRRSCGYNDLDVVRFSPLPGDAVLGRRVRVVISASGLGDDADTRLRVCCTSYPAAGFSLAQHAPSGVWPVREGGRCEEELSVEGTVKEERAFVLDVVVEARDENSMTWTQRGTGRAVYVLSPDGDNDAADGDEKDDEKKDTAAATAKVRDSAALTPALTYLSKLSFFYELRSDPEAAAALVDEVRAAAAALLYEDVDMLPVGVAEVCGVRGLVGDLFFPRDAAPRSTAAPLAERDAAAPFARSLLSLIGRRWWPSPPAAALGGGGGDSVVAWPVATAVYEAVQASFRVCLEKVEEEEWAARQSFAKELEWSYQVLEQEALNLFPGFRPRTPLATTDIEPPVKSPAAHCLAFTAGRAELWRDAADVRPRLRLPASILPSTVPLTLFGVRPRELFSVASTQKMKTMAARKAVAAAPKTLMEETYDQQDWTFMRLSFPFLPNLLRCDWERLPLALRNTERALCESLVRNPALVSEPGMLFSTDRIFSLLLSYLALLQSAQLRHGGSGATDGASSPAAGPPPASALEAVYAALQQGTPSFWDDCGAAMHFSATLFVLPPFRSHGGAAKAVPHSRPLFLGSRDNIVSDAFEVPRDDNAGAEMLPFPLVKDLTLHCTATVALETLVEAEGEGRGEGAVENLVAGREPAELRTISTTELPWRCGNASTPLLYHPLPRVAVLASPVVERVEYSPDALGRLQLDSDSFAQVRAEAAEAAMVRRRVVLQYRCMGKFSEKDPYKTISYGRVSSLDMFKDLIRDRARGKEVQAYMSLLLRRSSPAPLAADEAAPDGVLTVHGVPAEALYVHYRSRADLRFTLGTICPPLRQALLEAEGSAQDPAQRAAAVDAAEAALFNTYAEVAAEAVRAIYERVRKSQRSDDAAEQISLLVTLQPWDDAIPPYVAVQVFPVYATDADVASRVLDQERIWHSPDAYRSNPHKAFSLVGNRFGRLPLAELRIRYDAVASKFALSWDERFESGTNPADTAHH